MTLVQDPTQKTNCHKNTDQHSSSIIFCLVCDKWTKHTLQHCLWTMHSPQAPTMLDFAIILRNAVWININFCKINDIWRARGAYWFVHTIDLYKNLLMCTHQVHPTCSHDCAKARWPPQHAYITTHHTTTHTTTTPHIQNSNQNGAMPVAKVVWHNDLSAGSKNSTEANQAALWLAWAMP